MKKLFFSWLTFQLYLFWTFSFIIISFLFFFFLINGSIKSKAVTIELLIPNQRNAYEKTEKISKIQWKSSGMQNFFKLIENNKMTENKGGKCYNRIVVLCQTLNILCAHASLINKVIISDRNCIHKKKMKQCFWLQQWWWRWR